MKKYKFLLILTLLVYSITLSTSCKTVDFDNLGADTEKEKGKSRKTKKQEKEEEEAVLRQIEIDEALKNIEIEKTVVYVEKPVYYPVEDAEKRVQGKEAVKKSTSEAIVSPELYRYGTMYYDFNADHTYEIYCQPYRTTDLQLEPGEQVIEMPFLSENTVWEIGAGVSRTDGQDTQHFFIKPAYSGLETSFIIITDKRIYHLMLKSFKDCYMTQVKWKYPDTMPYKLIPGSYNTKENNNKNNDFGIDPRFLSFDYKMRYNRFKKPYWLPYRVYDDGEKTYITMNETVLHMTSPVLFNKRNERINYSVNKNLIVINELIEKVTLRIGRNKVTITKKNYKPSKIDEAIEKKAAKEPDAFRGIHQPIMKEGPLSPESIPVQNIEVTEENNKPENTTGE